MIYKHKFLKDILLEGKQIREVTAQKPVLFIVQNNQFLHYTISRATRHMKMASVIKIIQSRDLEDRRKNMGHQVPTLIYYNQVLQTNQLIQFLCDAFITDNEQIDFESRKSLFKEMVQIWKQIFTFQRLYPHDFARLSRSSIAVSDQYTYKNFILEQLQVLSVNFYGKIIQRGFAGFSEETPTLQSIIFVDIINTILQKIPASFVDYSLRNCFHRLIQLKDKLQAMIERSQPRNDRDRVNRHEVVLYRKIEDPEPNWEHFRNNSKRFLLLFGFMTTMYSIFVKP